MKREILCLDCKPKSLGLIVVDDKYGHTLIVDPCPGEHQKVIKGTALKPFVCDRCNKPIDSGDECYASSIWVDNRGGQYYSWENNYIKW
jgi:hypothetical protein